MPDERRKKILVVEDEPNAAKLAQYTLEGEGYEVVVASDGLSGLEIATTQEDVALIVLDVMMPGMNGFEVCSKLRLQPEMDELPVLMLTAKTGEQDKFNGLVLAEANAYMTKPADPAELVETVKTLLNRYPNPRSAISAAAPKRLPSQVR